MGHVFISYSRRDTEYAHKLADDLQARGFDTWIDARIDYGSQWPHELQRQLDTCEAFILVMSPSSFASEWVQSELQRAKRKQKPIFPLLLMGDEPWLSVESTQYYDVRGGVLPDDRLYSALKKVVSGSQESAAYVSLPKPGGKAGSGTSGPGVKRGWRIAGAGAAVVLLAVGAAIMIPRFLNTFDPGPPTPESARTVPVTETSQPAGPATEEPQAVAMTATLPVPITGITSGSSEFMDAKGVAMVLVEAGNFIAGSDTGYDDEKPVHTVYLDEFYIDKYEVTNFLYKACVEAGACDMPNRTSSFTRDSYYGNSQYDNHPVVFVDWDDARAYCQWRGMDLPSEAQWEKAARGTDGRSYPWGSDIDQTRANYNDTVGDTTAVGSYANGQSPYGAHDMAGNAWEWVLDWYSPTYYLDTTLTDPTGPESGDFHVLRGGSWHDDERNVRTSNRGWNQLEYFHNIDFGFRCAMDGKP